MYSCLICKEKEFTTPQFLYKHLIDHKLKHSCLKCDEICTTRTKRRIHLKLHARITCVICNTEIEKMNEKEHSKLHEYLYSVDQLNGIVDIINLMQDSTSSYQKVPNIVEYQGSAPNCPVKDCEKKFANPNDLINHFINHRLNHLCKFCNEIFPNNETFNAHSENKICRFYSCHNCRKDFSFEGFIRHITRECENKNLFDNMDNEPIETQNTRKIYRIYDEIQYSFTCHVCEDEFENVKLLNDHIKTHDKKLNVCAKCFCVFDEEQELQDHVTLGCALEELPADTRIKLSDEIREFLENHTKSRTHFDANKKVYKMAGDSVLFQCNLCDSKFVKFLFLKEHCAKFNHELIVCYKCLYLFNTCDEFRKHYCLKMDYSSFSELQFREQFQKCIKRKYETQNEICAGKQPTKQEYFRTLMCNNDDVVQRMSGLIHQLENVKFPDVKVTKSVTEITPSTSASVKSSNDYYDLNKILPRIMERRNKRLFNKTDEDSEEELEKIGNNLHDLNICKKHLLIENDEYNLDKVLPRIMKLRNKRHNEETVENIAKFLKKRNKNSSDESEDTSDYVDKCEAFLELNEESDESDEIPNKINKY